MTVKELIESLRDADEDAQVILSSDAEGNSFAKIDDVYNGYFLPRKEYESTARFDDMRTYGDLDPEDEDREYDKRPDELGGNDVVCVVIYPI